LFGAINSCVLNLLLLPLIIFESGWSLRRQDFLSQIAYILLFAIMGTLISVAVVAAILKFVTGWHLQTVLIYASLISAVDPVATLSTYGALKVEPLLNTLVFGESVINDAVAIALFNALNAAGKANCESISDDHDRQTMIQMAPQISLDVLWIMSGSLTLGVMLGILYCLIIRFAHLQHNAVLETLYIVISCFFTYALAHAVNLSGIIAVLFCSILMNVYAKRSLSKEGAELSGFLLKQMATLADMGVFLFCGAAVVLVHDATEFAAWVMFACLVGRAVAVFPLGALTNCLKKATGHARGISEEDMNLVSCKHLFMMWHAGLRGGIALVLCLELGAWIDVLEGEGTRQRLRNATFITIFVFLLVFGGSTQAFLKMMGIPMGKESDTSLLFKKEAPRFVQVFVDRIHNEILLPVLVGHDDDDEATDPAMVGSAIEAIIGHPGLDTNARELEAASSDERGRMKDDDSDESGT
jgi:sodium/hydrogen exchanger 8